MNPLFCFSCLCSFCFTFQTVFISTHACVFPLLPSHSLPHPTGWERGAELLPGVRPQPSEMRVQSGASVCWMLPRRATLCGDCRQQLKQVPLEEVNTGFPLGNLLSLRTSRASASGRQPAAPTDLGRRQMALQDPGWSTLSPRTTSTRTLSVCACASGGALAVCEGGTCAGEGGVKVTMH